MKTPVARICFFLSISFFLSACLVDASKQSNVTPIGVTQTTKPSVQIALTDFPSTNSSISDFILSNSPDNKYSVELDLSITPVELTILNNATKQKTQMPITLRHYNKIVGEGPIGFKWSTDNQILMFVLYREPFTEKRVEDFTSFVAINIEEAKPITINYSSMFRGLWYQDGMEMAVLEHGGLNDIDDFYFSGTNCYKGSLESECESSYVSPNGNWELSQWEQDADITVTSLSDDIWKYSYPEVTIDLNYLLSIVQRWADNEEFVFFSPSQGYGTSKVYGLYRMDLTNGNVDSLIGNNDTIDQYYYLSVSPTAERFIYITMDNKLVIKRTNDDIEKNLQISLSENESISNFTWSPDETKVIFAKLKRDKENNIISADYLKLDTVTGDLITLLRDEPSFLNAIKITNSEVLLGQQTYSLVDGMILEQTKP